MCRSKKWQMIFVGTESRDSFFDDICESIFIRVRVYNVDRSSVAFIWLLRYSGDVPAAGHTFTGVIVRGDRCYLIWELFPFVGKHHRKGRTGCVTSCHIVSPLGRIIVSAIFAPAKSDPSPRSQSKKAREFRGFESAPRSIFSEILVSRFSRLGNVWTYFDPFHYSMDAVASLQVLSCNKN